MAPVSRPGGSSARESHRVPRPDSLGPVSGRPMRVFRPSLLYRPRSHTVLMYLPISSQSRRRTRLPSGPCPVSARPFPCPDPRSLISRKRRAFVSLSFRRFGLAKIRPSSALRNGNMALRRTLPSIKEDGGLRVSSGLLDARRISCIPPAPPFLRPGNRALGAVACCLAAASRMALSTP